MRRRTFTFTAGLAMAAFVLSAASVSAQIVQRPGVPAELANKLPAPPPVSPPPTYVIGPNDLLSINVYREPPWGDVRVRPDGKITLPVGDDIVAAGLTVDELRKRVTDELKKGFFTDPTVFIQVREIKSRWVYITGSVAKQGPYELMGPMTVLQLITNAGGLSEFADQKNIRLISATLKDKNGQPISFRINYKELLEGKNLSKNNPELRPGDQVIVKGGL